MLSLLLSLTKENPQPDGGNATSAVRFEPREGYDIVCGGRVLGRLVERDSDAGGDSVDVYVRQPGRLFCDRVRIRKDDVVSVDTLRRRLMLRSAGEPQP